jgi:PAS domain S-box-containing protein
MEGIANVSHYRWGRKINLPNRALLSKAMPGVALICVFGLLLGYVGNGLNPILSHNIAETFSVVVACGIFMMTWNARRYIDNHYYLFLGISYFFVGVLDYVHALSFDGHLPPDSNNLHAQLWFAARYLQSVSLLVAPAFADRKLNPAFVFAGQAGVTLLLLASILSWGVFPAFFTNGTDATGIKYLSELAVAVAQGIAIGLLYRKRGHFDFGVYRLLVWSIMFSIASGLAGELYADALVYSNLFAHYMKIVSFYLVYRAVIATGLRMPYDLLFRNLKRSEEEIRAARDGLESRVAERTAELQAVNARLEWELFSRQRAMEMRELILDLHQLTTSIDSVKEFTSSLTSFLKDRFGFDAVGIRYRRGSDFPYYETRDFPQEFVHTEMNMRSAGRSAAAGGAGDKEPFFGCACGALIAGRCDPSLPFLTPNGTFWTNSISELLASGQPLVTNVACGRCAMQGYESIALVPMRLGEATLGLLQFNDRRKGRIEPHRLTQLERVAENAAGALARLIAREALQESEDRFRSLVENSLVGILIVQDGLVMFRNPALERCFGPIPEGIPFRELGEVHAEDRPKFELLCESMTGGAAAEHATDIRFFPGGMDPGREPATWVNIRTSSIEYCGRMATLVNLVDITRVKDLEQIVVAREKLASLGQLAAGIAHEIRNPLSGINVNVSVLEHQCRRAEGLEPADEARIGATVGNIKLASDKIASVIRRVMEFSKPVPPKLGLVDLNGIIEESLLLSGSSLRRHGIGLQKSLAPDLPKSQADSRLLGQVLLNLITNAIQAMDNVDGDKRLEVASSLEGSRVVISVSDSGPGIPPHIRGKIFDPFYTTRKDGHGIGLSFSQRVMADHRGGLSVSASRWGGAEFRIELPLKASVA